MGAVVLKISLALLAADAVFLSLCRRTGSRARRALPMGVLAGIALFWTLILSACATGIHVCLALLRGAQ